MEDHLVFRDERRAAVGDRGAGLAQRGDDRLRPPARGDQVVERPGRGVRLDQECPEAWTGAGRHDPTVGAARIAGIRDIPTTGRVATPGGRYSIVSSRRGFSTVIVSISASPTPASRSRGRKVSARYV